MAIKVGNIPAFDQYPTVGIGLSVPFQSTATSGSDSIFNIKSYFILKKATLQYFISISKIGTRNSNNGVMTFLSTFCASTVLKKFAKNVKNDNFYLF